MALLLISSQSEAQWRELLRGRGYFTDVFFLDSVGAPNIGFVGDGGYIYRTSDGGATWDSVNFSIDQSDLALDFTFKNSNEGWMAVYGNDVLPGLYKTSDGGLTWLPVSQVNALLLGIYYDKKSGGLFLSGSGPSPAGNTLNPTDELSSDEGMTWYPFASVGDQATGGFAFANGDTGLMAWQDTPGGSWWRTMDGGHSWNPLALDSPCYQPLAISGTSTYFAFTDNRTVMRSDDNGDTWQTLWIFPEVPRLSARQNVSSGCIAGQLNNLVVLGVSGCFRSTDEGLTWSYLCGVGSIVGDGKRFFVRSNQIFITTEDTLGQHVWRLNLDSMQYFSSKVVSQFPNAAKDTTVTPGSNVTVNFLPTTDPLIGVDTAHFFIHYDFGSLSLENTIIPPGWSTLKSSSGNGTFDLWIVSTNAVALPTPVLQLTFGTVLSPTTAKVHLDSAHLYGKRLNCDCAALSVAGPDSVQINFEGCGDSLILAAMNHTPPFSIESVQPNPASTKITVNLAQSAKSPIAYELSDALGSSYLNGDISSSSAVLDVDGLSSGAYYLRLMSNGYVQTRRVNILH
jgi:photosystem II stability/assembly factor-like uncharacterized protein